MKKCFEYDNMLGSMLCWASSILSFGSPERDTFDDVKRFVYQYSFSIVETYEVIAIDQFYHVTQMPCARTRRENASH